ncbi:Ig-like domain-containing protein, partial [Caballeronia sordidicola]|uniref:Ig-like domain-containing protein n=1 Tax=Caballeronia sordidicola TaxID=196367 RepID=UPI00211AD83C
DWSFKPAIPLADGAHDITATQANPATGKVSLPSGDWPFNVDTSVPAAPTISGVTDNVGPIQGPVPAHGTTDDNDPVIAGKGVPGDIVHVLDNGVDIGSTTVNPSGDWTFKPTVPLADGPHDITAEQSNPATGATSGPSQDFPFNVDTTTPVAPSITQVLDAVGAVTGPVPKNGSTDDNDPVISGKGVAGDVVHVMDNGKEIGSTTVSGTGDWSFKPATALADGAHDITATQANPATGKVSLPSSDWPFNVDTVHRPDAPVINDMVEYSSNGDPLGSFPSGSITPSPIVRLYGTADANAVVYLYEGNTLIGSTACDASGVWLYQNTKWATGPHDITATQKNTAGIESAHSNDWLFSVGNIPAPSETIVITNMIDHTLGNVSVGNNGSTSDSSPTIQGTLSHALLAGETLVIIRDSQQVGIATASGTSWSFNDSGLSLGSHNYYAKVVGIAGHSDVSNYFYITEIAPAAVIPVETVVINNLTDHTSGANIPAGSSTTDKAPVVHGSVSSALLAGETLAVYRDGQKVGTATVSGTGWTFNDSGVGTGIHTYTAQVENTNGHGPVSNPFTFNEIAPAAPIPTETVAISSLTDHTSGANIPAGSSTTDTAPVVHGSVSSALLAGETLAVYRDGQKVGTATVSGTGWTFNDSGVGVGSHTYTAQVENSSGNGPRSGPFTFNELSNVPSAPVITDVQDAVGPVQGPVPNNGTTDDNQPTIRGTGTAGDTLWLFVDGKGAGETTVDGTGHWSIKPSTAMYDGKHSFTTTQFASGQPQ